MWEDIYDENLTIIYLFTKLYLVVTQGRVYEDLNETRTH